jgi:phosphatidate phosphatase APP1
MLAAVALSATSVQVTGSGFVPGTSITVTIQSSPLQLGTVAADPTGAFTAVFSVPCTLGAGTHTVTASAASGQQAAATVNVPACPAAAASITVQPAFTG